MSGTAPQPEPLTPVSTTHTVEAHRTFYTPSSPFVRVELPPDGITINSTRYFSFSQIAKHLTISLHVLHTASNKGLLSYIIQPGLFNGKRLVCEQELIRFMTLTSTR